MTEFSNQTARQVAEADRAHRASWQSGVSAAAGLLNLPSEQWNLDSIRHAIANRVANGRADGIADALGALGYAGMDIEQAKRVQAEEAAAPPPAIRRIGNAIVDPAWDTEPTGLFGHQPPNEAETHIRIELCDGKRIFWLPVAPDDPAETLTGLAESAFLAGQHELMEQCGAVKLLADDFVREHKELVAAADQPVRRDAVIRYARQEGYQDGVRDAKAGQSDNLKTAYETGYADGIGAEKPTQDLGRAIYDAKLDGFAEGQRDIIDKLGGCGMTPDEFVRTVKDYRSTAAHVWSQWNDARISDDSNIAAILRSVTAEMTTKVELPPALDREATMAQIAYMASLVWVYDRHLAAAQEEAANGGG